MPSVMARAMGISLPAITHQLKALEKHGYVVREASATDRRRVYVSITEKGYLLMERMKQDRMKLLLGFIEFLGEEDSQKLLEIISRIREYVRTMKEARNNEQKGQKK
jgi:DNA-binding MarR family transcriptional regulator